MSDGRWRDIGEGELSPQKQIDASVSIYAHEWHDRVGFTEVMCRYSGLLPDPKGTSNRRIMWEMELSNGMGAESVNGTLFYDQRVAQINYVNPGSKLDVSDAARKAYAKHHNTWLVPVHKNRDDGLSATLFADYSQRASESIAIVCRGKEIDHLEFGISLVGANDANNDIWKKYRPKKQAGISFFTIQDRLIEISHKVDKSFAVTPMTFEEAYELKESRLGHEDYYVLREAGLSHREVFEWTKRFENRSSVTEGTLAGAVRAGATKQELAYAKTLEARVRYDAWRPTRWDPDDLRGEPPRGPLSRNERRLAENVGLFYLDFRQSGITHAEMIQMADLGQNFYSYARLRKEGLSHAHAKDVMTVFREGTVDNYHKFLELGESHERAVELLGMRVDSPVRYHHYVRELGRITHEQVVEAMHRDISKAKFPLVEAICESSSYFNALDGPDFADGSAVTHERAMEWLEAGGGGHTYRGIRWATDGEMSHAELMKLLRSGADVEALCRRLSKAKRVANGLAKIV